MTGPSLKFFIRIRASNGRPGLNFIKIISILSKRNENLWKKHRKTIQYDNQSKRWTLSQCQGLPDQFFHGISDRRRSRTSQIVTKPKQVRLYVSVRRVEYEIQIGLQRNRRDVFVPVDDFCHVKHFILEHFADLFATNLTFVFAVQIDQLYSNRPHFPGSAFVVLEQPSAAFLLEKLQTDLSGGGAFRAPQQAGKPGYFLAHGLVQRLRRTTHVREVDKIAIHICITDSPYGIAPFSVIHEFSVRAMEQDGVEDAGYGFVHLPPFHRQREHLGSSVHVATVWFIEYHLVPVYMLRKDSESKCIFSKKHIHKWII